MSLYIELVVHVTHEAYMHDNILELVHKFCKKSITNHGSSNYLILRRKIVLWSVDERYIKDYILMQQLVQKLAWFQASSHIPRWT